MEHTDDQQLKALYEQLYSLPPSASDLFVQGLEPHLTWLEKVKMEEDSEGLAKLHRMWADYAHALRLLERYKDALPYLDKAIGLFEQRSDISGDLFQIRFYELLFFDRAISRFHTGKKKLAQQDFKRLHRLFPHNEDYKTWAKGTKRKQYNLWATLLWGLWLALLLFLVGLEDKLPKFVTDAILFLMLLIGLPLLMWEGVKWWEKRGEKEEENNEEIQKNDEGGD